MEAALMSAFAVLSVLFFCFFCLGVFRDLRRFSNAVFLGLSLTSLAIDLMERLGEAGPMSAPMRVALARSVLRVRFGGFMLAFFLFAERLQMVRTDGRPPPHLP